MSNRPLKESMQDRFALECKELAERCLSMAAATNGDDVKALEWIAEMFLSLARRAEQKESNVIALSRASQRSY